VISRSAGSSSGCARSRRRGWPRRCRGRIFSAPTIMGIFVYWAEYFLPLQLWVFLFIYKILII
jgi:hypothetical protein